MSENHAPPARIERNPLTHQKHRNEVLWQISLPLLLGVGLVLAGAVIVSMGGVGGGLDTAKLAETSTIWLVVPMMIVCLVGLALVVGMVAAVTVLLNKMPLAARRVQDIFVVVQYSTAHWMDRLVEPVLKAEGLTASLRELREQLARLVYRRRG